MFGSMIIGTIINGVQQIIGGASDSKTEETGQTGQVAQDTENGTNTQTTNPEEVSVFNFDADGDGEITSEEAYNYAKYLETTEQAQESDDYDETWDLNGDGKMDDSETNLKNAFGNWVQQIYNNQAAETTEADLSELDTSSVDGVDDSTSGSSSSSVDGVDDTTSGSSSSSVDGVDDSTSGSSSSSVDGVDDTTSGSSSSSVDGVNDTTTTTDSQTEEVDINTFDANNDGKITSDEAYNYANFLAVTEGKTQSSENDESSYDEAWDLNNDGKNDESEINLKNAIGNWIKGIVNGDSTTNEQDNSQTNSDSETLNWLYNQSYIIEEV